MNKDALLDATLLAKIKSIQIRAKHIVSDAFAGEYRSAFKGRGLEFEEVREYIPGDDIRTIDWNVTARNDRPFVKLYRDERELTLLFIVDVSASSHFGTVSKFKHEVAAEITALLAYSALKNNDKVGLIIFSDHVEHYLPPKKGRAHIWRLIRDILTYRSESRATNLNIPLEFLNQVVKKKSIAFIISDFQSEDFEKQIRLTAKKHELIAISVLDPKELRLPTIGFIEFEDLETGKVVMIQSKDHQFQVDFQALTAENKKKQEKLFLSTQIDWIKIHTDESYFEPIIRYFKSRDRNRRSRSGRI